MSKYRDLSSGDVFPAYWTDAIQEFTGTVVAGLRLTTPSANTVRAVAATGSDQVAVGVSGLYRYRSSNAEVTISGTTGTYNLYAAVSENSIAGTTDSTDYNWYLYFGANPPSGTISGGGAISATRKIGEVDWDNVAGAITGLRQTVGAGDSTFPVTPTATRATVTPLSVRGIASQSANLISAGSSSSATDRLTLDSSGKLSLPVTGTSGGLTIGGDASLYRSASNTLRTAGSLIVDSTITADALVSTTSVSAATLSTSGNATVGGSLTANSVSSTTSLSAATLTTSGNATVGGNGTVTGNLTVSGTLAPAAFDSSALGVAIVSKSSSHTLVLSDKDKVIEMNSSSANTLTVPLDADANFPVGSEVMVVQMGTGATTIDYGIGLGEQVTLYATPGTKLRAQYSAATLIKRAANSWLLAGDLTT